MLTLQYTLCVWGGVCVYYKYIYYKYTSYKYIYIYYKTCGTEEITDRNQQTFSFMFSLKRKTQKF